MSVRLERLVCARFNRGVTLVELMVAMLLGLIVVGGALSLIAANKQSYRTNEALAQVQESARTAFELLARDIRQAGSTGCDNSGRVGFVLNSSTNWWQNWAGLVGYEGTTANPAVTIGTATGERVSATDSFQIRGTESPGLSIKTHDPSAATLELNATSAVIANGDILLACDFDHATILQATSYDATAKKVAYTNGPGAPGNCSKGLGYPVDCSSVTGNVYTFRPNSQLARFAASSWYIGNNGRPEEGGRSLFRRRLGSGGVSVTEEVVAGVTDLQIQYRLNGSNEFLDASSPNITTAGWDAVNAVQLTLTMRSADAGVTTAPGTNNGRLQRTFTHLVTLRNRVP